MVEIGSKSLQTINKTALVILSAIEPPTITSSSSYVRMRISWLYTEPWWCFVRYDQVGCQYTI